MPITNPEWESISQMIDSVVRRVVGTRADFFTTGKVVKVDAVNKCVYLAELGDQPIPVVGFDRSVKYYDSAQQFGFAVAGVILDFGGASAPPGFLLCDGTSYLRTDYPDLFATISTAYGAADGTHFNVPDFRDRVAVGKSGTRALGSTGGAATHTLSLSEIPSHSHGIIGYVSNNIGSSGELMLGNNTTGVSRSTDAQGSGATHNNMQPYAVTNKIISIGTVPQVSAKTAASEVAMPKVGDSVLVAREMGTRRLPRALGVIQGKNWIVAEEE